ncbi:ABC transporter ATP-binding protein [Thermosipho ferrireducens]|uniref:ABC transporter ATP-binding protein n=1 Tax=Thermosipho ferrireducens TaxID=2571116 RepID=A0ABX7S4X6_9BACT|nr:ABC transporter ATP-binding protein [Thermosipho ferrireducens]QTA37539.1 ABC transporter ATP-binding protein [Thermosipho ferrireducens]
MKEFYKYFYLFHKLLSPSLFIKKLFIDIAYFISRFLSLMLPIFLGKIVDNFGKREILPSLYAYVFVYSALFLFQQISGINRRTFSIVDGPKYLFEKGISNVLKRKENNFVPEKEMDKIFSFSHIFEFFYATFSLYVLIVPVMMAFSIGMIMLNEWKAGIVAIFSFIFTWMSSNKKMKVEEKAASQMNEAEYSVAETLSDLYSGYEDIRAYETFNLTFRWVEKVLNGLKKAYYLFGKVEVKFGLTYEFVSILTMPIITFILGFEVFSGNLSAGKAIMLLVYAERVQDYSEVYIQDTDYIAWAVARAKVAYKEYLKEDE